MISAIRQGCGLLCLASSLLLIFLTNSAWADLPPPPLGGDPPVEVVSAGVVGAGIALSTVITGGFLAVVFVRRRNLKDK